MDVRDDNPDLPARLTDMGREKQRNKERGERVTFIAGCDYRIKGPRGGERREWIALPENEFTSMYCHDWVIVRNNRSTDPTFAACPMPRSGPDEADRNAAAGILQAARRTDNDDSRGGDVAEPRRPGRDSAASASARLLRASITEAPRPPDPPAIASFPG